jgi:hypothetical protein
LERALYAEDGSMHVKGGRAFANNYELPGSGNLRVMAATSGGYALETYDFVNYWPLQVVRDISGVASMVGGISCTDFSTTFVTSSDYRLKEDLRPVESPLDRLKDLKVFNFRWIGTDRRTDGFIAHELAKVIPDAVTGEKDAVREVERTVEPAKAAVFDDEGRELSPRVPAVTVRETVPAYQGVDQSKVVPLLVAAVQRLAEMVEDIQNALAANGAERPT